MVRCIGFQNRIRFRNPEFRSVERKFSTLEAIIITTTVDNSRLMSHQHSAPSLKSDGFMHWCISRTVVRVSVEPVWGLELGKVLQGRAGTLIKCGMAMALGGSNSVIERRTCFLLTNGAAGKLLLKLVHKLLLFKLVISECYFARICQEFSF